MVSEWDLIQYRNTSGTVDSGKSYNDRIAEALHSPIARDLLSQFAKAAAPALSSGSTSSSRSSSVPLPSSLRVAADNNAGDDIDSQWQALQVAAASLTIFVQINWTGPGIVDDWRPAALLRWADPSAFGPRKVTIDREDDIDEDKRLEDGLNAAATDALTLSGEPAYHLCEQPFFLTLAVRILEALNKAPGSSKQAKSLTPKLETLPWWTLRAAHVRNRVLDTPVPLPDSILQPVDALIASFDSRATDFVASAAADNSAGEPWQLLKARLLIERGLAVSKTGHDKEANDYFVKSAQATGLKYELSGALGKRTKFQKDEKTILVVLAESSRDTLGQDAGNEVGQAEEEEDANAAAEAEDAVGELPVPSSSGWNAAPAPGQRSDMPSNYALNDENLLEQTRFTSNAKTKEAIKQRDPNKQPALAPLDQCILLALSLFISNMSPEHGLTASQISAFVSRVALHPRNWSVYTMALLLRSRLEATRTRTAERSVLQLQALLDQMPTADSPAPERLAYFFQLDLPAKWEMQAELAKRYATLGVLRSALEIYERIELWEEVVQCLGALGRQEEGIDVVKDLLEGRKTEADQVVVNKKTSGLEPTQPRRLINAARKGKLWCLLGDLEPDHAESHYMTGWEVSGHHSSRAARSLGGVAFAKKDYPTAIRWLHRALKISALMPRSWFMLGCAYMRREEFGRAARSFRRATAIDEEDGEAWNNLASCYLRLAADGDSLVVQDIEDDAVGVDEDGNEEEDGSSDAGSTRTAMSVTSDRTITTDSGVELSENEQEDDDEELAAQLSERRQTRLTPFILKTLAHRCLKHSLRYSPDSWRVWSNLMIVSIDIGELREACSALSKVVRIKARAGGAGRLQEGDIDWDVVQRLVDAVIRAPGSSAAEVAAPNESAAAAAAAAVPVSEPVTSYQDAVASAASVPVSSGDAETMARSSNPNVGRGLYPAVLDLFTNVLLPALSSPQMHRAHARLLVWRKEYHGAVEAHLAAFRCSVASPTSAISAEDPAALWRESVAEVKETVDSLETLAGLLGAHGGEEGGEEEERKTRFKARSLVRTFLARNRDNWEDTPEWDELVSLRNSLS